MKRSRRGTMRAKRRGRSSTRYTRLQQGGDASATQSAPLYEDAYVITLQDEFPERFRRINEHATAAGITLKPWKGVKITPQDLPGLPPKGVGTTHYTDRTGKQFNFGAIGCFLAHRNLLEHLAGQAQAAEATLVFEDDVAIPPDFKAKLAAVQSEFPADWDILFLDKIRPQGKMVSPHVMKLERDMTSTKNWGTWAYLVKNSSIKDKVLPTLEHMLDGLDMHINKFAHTLNIYLLQPGIVTRDNITFPASSIGKMDERISNANK